MKYAVMLMVGLMVLAGAGAAVAGHSVLCLNLSATLGFFLSLITNGTPDDTDILGVPAAILDSTQCH
ncbi:MAG TPA: hypothetical protein VGR28_08465 [Candidatus Thermoplasmatota archaeon]|nr:hypothetical protein [Candidatus Thermoplasmatota archaeon]